MVGNTGPELFLQARRELGLDNRALAKVLGVGLRTVERHGVHILYEPVYGQRFVRAVHPHNPELAARLAQAAGTSLKALGLEPATPAERAAARGNVIASSDEALAVIHATVAATGLSVEQARVGLAAGVAMAINMGLTLEQLDPVLNPKKPSRR
jgi:type IV secretory pathway TrbD component